MKITLYYGAADAKAQLSYGRYIAYPSRYRYKQRQSSIKMKVKMNIRKPDPYITEVHIIKRVLARKWI